jgi:hypothetical protein
MHIREQRKQTGYSVPLTRTTLTRPRTTIGNDLRMAVTNFGLRGAVKWDGSLIKGIAETTPLEKTKEPTPKSIFGQHRNDASAEKKSIE